MDLNKEFLSSRENVTNKVCGPINLSKTGGIGNDEVDFIAWALSGRATEFKGDDC